MITGHSFEREPSRSLGSFSSHTKLADRFKIMAVIDHDSVRRMLLDNTTVINYTSSLTDDDGKLE